LTGRAASSRRFPPGAGERDPVERGFESTPAGPDRAVPPPPAGIGVPPYVRRVVEQAARAEIRLVRDSGGAPDPRTPVLIGVVKDEMAVLADLLEHYRGLGVERFALLDNGSTDATPDFLAAQPDVDLYATRQPFQRKQAWVNALIARYGYDRWYLHVDADEHVVFDGAPGRTLADVVGFAAARGLRRVRGMLVDMYAPGPILAAAKAPGQRLAERFRLFDGDDYAETLCLERISRKGGPRRRKFTRENDVFDPELSKYPLFHIRAGEVASSPHHIYPYRENYLSDCYLAILHYKFTPGLLDKARRAAVEGNYWHGSLEYRRYLEALARDRRLSLSYPGTRRYGGPADLLAAGLIAPIPWTGRRSLLRSVAALGRQLRTGA
jgi:Glycosyl transferase family 2